MRTNTSFERVNTLMQRSDSYHHKIDQLFDGEVRARRMLRVGINATAITLRHGGSVHEAGAQLMVMPLNLPRQTGPLDTLSNQYADVRRATLNSTGALETDARHAVHLTHQAVRYAAEYYPNLDPQEIAVYAWLHDIVEAYADDVSSLGMTPDQEAKKHHDEAAALAQIKADYGRQWPELMHIIDEYESLTTSEARFVKTFDKLDPSLTHFASGGAQIKRRYGSNQAQFSTDIGMSTKRMERYSGEFPQLMEDRAELIRRVAAVSFENAA